MRARLLALLFILAGAVGVVWYGWQGNLQQLVKDGVSTLEKTVQEVITPPPLRGPLTGEPTYLTVEGVFQFTNQHRQENNVAALTRNSTLDQAARNKVNDMFARQYFEHVSPTGEGPADVVEGVGYSYIRVGENLALGNFPSDADLVQAWMDSPGHRANILDDGFQEIGIAVGQGTFEGQQTWLAVQTFGTPASVCTTPSSSLEKTINTNQAKTTALEKELATLQQQVEQLLQAGNAKVEEGNAEIQEGNRIYKETGDESAARPHWDRGEALQAEGKALLEQAEQQRDVYNQKVSEINELVATTKKIVDQYNTQVREFNTCVESLS